MRLFKALKQHERVHHVARGVALVAKLVGVEQRERELGLPGVEQAVRERGGLPIGDHRRRRLRSAAGERQRERRRADEQPAREHQRPWTRRRT